MTRGLSSPEPEDGGAVARDAALLPDGVTPGATNPPDPGSGATEGTGGLRNDLRASTGIVSALMAAFKPDGVNGRYREPDPRDTTTLVVYPDADGRSSMRALSFGEIADALINDGWRRVVEDDGTLSKIATVLAAADGLPITPGHLAAPFAERPLYVSKALAIAGAVVRALREETA